MSVAAQVQNQKALPSMEKLLDILYKKRFITIDDKTLLDFMSIDSSELADITTDDDDDNEDSSNEPVGDVTEINDAYECSEDAKSFALTLYYHSADAYDYIRTHYRTCLPPLPILWTGYIHPGALPGFCQESLEAIANKVQKSQDKIYCALSFKGLNDFSVGDQYVDGKGYFGFEDFGSKIETDCQDKATNALFFMASAVNGTWSLPVGYFLLRNTSDKLARIINIAIYLLEKNGVEVVSLSYDNSCKRAIEELGCKLKQKDPKTTFKANKKDVCVFPDYKDLGETICQCLSWFKEFVDGDGKPIAWKHISKLDKKRKRSSDFDNERDTETEKYMLTRAMALSLKHDKESKTPSFTEVDGTITFIEHLNDFLDIFSSQENGTELKQPITNDNKTMVIEKVDELAQYFMKIKCKQPVDFMGLAVAAKSLKEMIKLYSGENGLKCIPTHKMSMDAVDHMFDKIKQYAQVRDIRAYKLHLAYKKFLTETV